MKGDRLHNRTIPHQAISLIARPLWLVPFILQSHLFIPIRQARQRAAKPGVDNAAVKFYPIISCGLFKFTAIGCWLNSKFLILIVDGPLKPGMTSMMDIRTDITSVMFCLARPVFKAFGGAVHERDESALIQY